MNVRVQHLAVHVSLGHIEKSTEFYSSKITRLDCQVMNIARNKAYL